MELWHIKMRLKTKKPTSPLLRLFYRLYTIVIVVFMGGFCGCVSLYLIITGIVESMARSLAPPAYPGSILIGTYINGGSHAAWATQTYHTTDGVDKVLAYMEQHLKGFNPIQSSQGGGYANEVCRKDTFARLASWAATGEQSEYNRPCVVITIQADKEHPQLTVIRIETYWPAD
jgi:hypothetical protein